MKDIITTAKYKIYQPDIEVVGITDIQIQSAINTATSNINSLTGCIAYEVWDYNIDENGQPIAIRDINNKLYRNDKELEWIQDAWLSQTQYVLSNGNDFHNGQESFSGGGISYSQTLSERPLIRQDVYNYLVKARVYERSINIGANKETREGACGGRLGAWDGTGMTTLVDREWADSRYVLHNQPDDCKGKFAYCDPTTGNVVFEDLSQFSWNNITNKPNINYIDNLAILQDAGNENLHLETHHVNLASGVHTTNLRTLPTASTSRNGLLSKNDKIKLNSLSEHFRGHYASLDALKTAIPTANGGDYAYIESGASNLGIAFWDTGTTPNQWRLSDSESGITSLGIAEDVFDTTSSKSLSIISTDPNNIVLAFNRAPTYNNKFFYTYTDTNGDVYYVPAPSGNVDSLLDFSANSPKLISFSFGNDTISISKILQLNLSNNNLITTQNLNLKDSGVNTLYLSNNPTLKDVKITKNIGYIFADNCSIEKISNFDNLINLYGPDTVIDLVHNNLKNIYDNNGQKITTITNPYITELDFSFNQLESTTLNEINQNNFNNNNVKLLLNDNLLTTIKINTTTTNLIISLYNNPQLNEIWIKKLYSTTAPNIYIFNNDHSTTNTLAPTGTLHVSTDSDYDPANLPSGWTLVKDYV